MKELSQRWKTIQGNMALEGHHISDERLARLAEKYEASGHDDLIEQTVRIADETGEDLCEIYDRLRKDSSK